MWRLHYWREVHDYGASWFVILRFLWLTNRHGVGELKYHDEPENMAAALRGR